MKDKELLEILLNELRKKFDENIEIKSGYVIKENKIKKEAILFVTPEKTITPTIYLDRIYEIYKSGKSIEMIVADIVDIYEKQTIKGIFDYEDIKASIVYKLINYDLNKDVLKNVPHIRYLDFAIVFQMILKEPQMVITVINNHLKQWGVSTEELFSQATKNTSDLFPSKMQKLDNLILKLPKEDQEIVYQTIPKQEVKNLQMYVLTNERMLNGATVILYPNKLKEMGQLLKSDFYILPSSLHEVILLPSDDCSDEKIAELKSTVMEVNQNVLTQEEFLSDSVYYYNRMSDELMQVA